MNNNNNVYVSKEEAQRRLAICNNCIHFLKLTNQCALCGCDMRNKVNYKQAECADDKLKRW